MDISKLSFVARKRTPWQVFDFCQLMVRANFISMMKIVACLYLPIAIISWQLFSLTTASYIIWWLKPLLERPLLDFLAKQSFAQPTTTWSCIKVIKDLRVVDILAMLTYRRLSPNRAYLASVEQLEKLTGNARTKRRSILVNRNNAKQSFWMIFCVHIEMLLAFLFAAIIFNFIPQGINIDLQIDSMDQVLVEIESIYYPCYLLAVMLVAPYFATGGFLMYLNSRVNIEAWDIELAFKKIAARSVKTATTCLLILVGTFALPSNELYAQEAQQSAIEQQDTASLQKTLTEQSKQQQADNLAMREQINNIYQAHQLIEIQTTWQPVEQKQSTNFEWLADFFSAFTHLSDIVGFLFWLVIILLAIWLIWVVYSSGALSGLMAFSQTKVAQTTKSDTVLPSFIRELNQQHWPENLLKAAKDAVNKQHFRYALRLTLKFALTFAQAKTSVRIYAYMTENECEQALLTSLPEQWHSPYQELFFLWIQLAWAHKPVEAEKIHQLIAQFQTIEQEREAI
ncbi:hypothetical protein [Thalassotalea sp. PLHSN55]|uniref:hypothetical protein n=1 Tax=Thalassotalea sp. PLHSN55 TaxID=3435888 RepID=UPI003F8759A8